MVINESMHSSWQISPFGSKWKLGTFPDLSVQAVKERKDDERGGGGGWGEYQKQTKKKKSGQKWQSIKQQLTVTASLQAGVNEQHRQTVLFPKDRFTVKL